MFYTGAGEGADDGQHPQDFDNLPSMRSSMGGSYDNFQNSDRSFEQ